MRFTTMYASMEQARKAKTVEDFRAVLRDIADRARTANSAAAVDSIAQIAEAALFVTAPGAFEV